MTTILHVAESFGGGVATAISEYMTSTPELNHCLLYGARTEVTEESWANFAWTKELPTGVAGLRAIRAAVREVRPDVVHAHSSWAGLFTRLAVQHRRTPIVYTPHCFAYERRDVSETKRLVFRAAERILAENTSALAGCSPHEATVGATWLSPQRSVYVPNIARTPADLALPASTARRVVAMGRLSVQKDPSWFAELAAHLRSDAEVLWIGGGEQRYADQLREVGATVTGWVSRTEAMTLLASATVHVLPSLWEGFPMAILEAYTLSVPTISRELPMLPEMPVAQTFKSPVAAAEAATQLLDSSEDRTKNLQSWASLLWENTPEIQRERLREAYRIAIGDTTVVLPWR